MSFLLTKLRFCMPFFLMAFMVCNEGNAAPSSASSSASDPSSQLKIGIIGAGWMGGTVGRVWVKAGYEVMFSSRHPDELHPMVEPLGENAHVGTPRQAASFGEVIFLATPYGAIPQISHDFKSELTGKIILDATNASGGQGKIFDEAAKHGMAITNEKYFAGAHLVRAFSSVWANAVESSAAGNGDKLAVPIASNDPTALEVAAKLVRAAGCEPVIAGDLSRAYLFEQGGPAVSVNTDVTEMRHLLGLPPEQ